jgi:hypothetical protein
MVPVRRLMRRVRMKNAHGLTLSNSAITAVSKGTDIRDIVS